MTALSFAVYGTPAPQGSKRHVGGGVMIESSKKVKPWRQDVKHAALEALGDRLLKAPPTGPVYIEALFRFVRPKSHYRTGANAHLLRDTAPTHPSGKPDIDKILRSTLDALGEAGVWRDDAQVVRVDASKSYAAIAGATLTIEEIA